MSDTARSREFVEAIRRLAESVDAFHRRFGIDAVDVGDTNAALEALRQRLALLSEEVGEHAQALNRADVEHAAKEAADVAYIAIGTLHRLGETGARVCHEVARKNDAKRPSFYTHRASTGKILMDQPERSDGKSGGDRP